MVDLDTLRQIALFADLSDEQFEFAKLGRRRSVESGEVLGVEGEYTGCFWVILDGEIQCTRRVGDRQLPWMNFGPQSYFGHELLLLNQPNLSTVRATCKSELLEFGSEAFWKMLELCPSVSRELLIITAQRTQELNSASMQAEKLVSLGTLTSGLAQELQQVSNTGLQAVEHLQNLFQWLQTLTVKLNAHCMTTEQQDFLLDLQQTVLERMTALPEETNPQAWRAQEDEIVAWFAERDLPHYNSCPTQQYFARILTRAGLDTAVLNDIARVVPEESICAVLGWLKATLKSIAIANDVEYSTQRIASMVQIAKDYTYLDQAPLQEMDIHEGLENTLIVLCHRIEPNIKIVREYDRTLPPICVYGGDLNQVWTHLIDNAIDAMQGHGKLTLRTSQVQDRILIEVIDSGPGISSDIQPFIFDQFFTTKLTDHGTGLGLPIAHRVVVNQHQGQIQVHSQPGRTCFQIYLPMNLTENAYHPETSQVA